MRRLHQGLLDLFNSRPFSLLLLGAAAIFCACAFVVTHSHAAALRDHGVRAQAVVTAVDDDDDYVTLKFTTQDGTRVVADVGGYQWSPEPHVGDTPTIVFDPDDPSGNVVDARLGPDFLATWLIAGGGVIAAVAFVLTLTGRLDWRAMARDRWGY